MTNASISDAKRFFSTGDPVRDSTRAFFAEWKSLDDSSRSQILAGLSDGSLSY